MSYNRILLRACPTVALAVLYVACGGPSDSGSTGTTNPPPTNSVAASVEITPGGSVTLDALQATQAVSAVVRTSSGAVISSNVTWSSDATTIVSVPASGGSMTAIAKGTAHITARTDNGVMSSPLTVVVQQKETQLVVVSGNGQTGTVATAVTAPLVVQANDRNGNAVAGASVTFATTTGTVGSATATTAANGQATATWTLPTVAGAATLTAALSSAPATTVTFSATARAGAAQRLLKIDGDLQRGSVSAALGNPLIAAVVDQFNNNIAGATLSFTVAAGGGSLSSSSITTAANGQGSVTWTLGSNEALPQTVQVSSPGLSGPAATYSATALRVDVGSLGPPEIKVGCHMSGTIKGIGVVDASHITATVDGLVATGITLVAAGTNQVTLSLVVPAVNRPTKTSVDLILRVYSTTAPTQKFLFVPTTDQCV